MSLSKVFCLLKSKSNAWDAIGRELGVPFDVREGIYNLGAARTDENKLEKVLNSWLESHCSETSWNHLMEVLQKELKWEHLAEEVKQTFRAS